MTKWDFNAVHREACRRLEEESWEDAVIAEMNRLTDLAKEPRAPGWEDVRAHPVQYRDTRSSLRTCGTCYRTGKPEEWQSCMQLDCPYTY